MNETLKSISEAAERWGVHPDTVRNLIEAQHVRPTRIAGRVLISESEIQRVIKDGAGDGRKPRARGGKK